MEELLALIQDQKYEQLSRHCSSIEIEFEEESFIHANENQWIENFFAFDFYTTYMLVLLCMENLDESKYLWKRAPSNFKNNRTSKFAQTWEVGKFLRKENFKQAIHLLSSSHHWKYDQQNNDKIVGALVCQLRDLVISTQINLHCQVYANLSLSMLEDKLGVQSAELRQWLSKLGYELTADNIVKNSGCVHQNKEVSKNKSDYDLLKEDMQELQQLTQCTALLASKDILGAIDDFHQQEQKQQQQQQQQSSSNVSLFSFGLMSSTI